jgi:DnaJ-class molecular chaperone
MKTPGRSDLDSVTLVLVTCSDCSGSGLTDNSDGTVACDICGGYGECWVDEQDATPETRVHKEKR